MPVARDRGEIGASSRRTSGATGDCRASVPAAAAPRSRAHPVAGKRRAGRLHRLSWLPTGPRPAPARGVPPAHPAAKPNLAPAESPSLPACLACSEVRSVRQRGPAHGRAAPGEKSKGSPHEFPECRCWVNHITLSAEKKNRALAEQTRGGFGRFRFSWTRTLKARQPVALLRPPPSPKL